MKIYLVEFLDLSRDAIHIYVGLIVFFFAVIFWKKGKIVSACLIPVLIAAFSMEALDVYDDLSSKGRVKWVDSAHDIVNTSFWPLVIFGLVRIGAVK